MEPYRIIVRGGTGEIVEKKSRFIANIIPAASEEEAVNFIEETKKKYWDARHNCTAMIIGENSQITRCSDDGEPSQTAGRPMLEVLINEGIKNVCVVVTRYFGGTLLGTGGLVRAYQAAVKEGLKNCEIGVVKSGINFNIETDYNGIGKIQYILAGKNIPIINSQYTDTVTLEVTVEDGVFEGLVKEITDATSGKAVVREQKKVSFIDKDFTQS